MDCRDNDGASSMSVVGHIEKVWRPLRKGSLTIMKVVKDGPLRVQGSAVDVR